VIAPGRALGFFTRRRLSLRVHRLPIEQVFLPYNVIILFHPIALVVGRSYVVVARDDAKASCSLDW